MVPSRLSPAPTQRIDRGAPLRFTWCGRPLSGLAGDTVASALWAGGVRVLGRSFEYHRPRGLYDLDGEGSSGLVAIDGVPNRSSGTVRLADGMEVTAQNVRGDPRRDFLGVLDRLDRLMPAGFYYRMFHRPRALQSFFQNRMRALAGLGRLDPDRVPVDRRTELYVNADVAVLGGGPAGLAAALAASGAGLRVCLFERRPWLGGHLDWRVRAPEGGPPCFETARILEDAVSARPNVRVFRHAPACGIWGDNLVSGFQVGGASDPFAERYWECRARTVVVATGRIERPLVFAHNDRPGVMQADTAWRLARTYGVAPGRRLAFSVADDLGLEAALDLAGLGVEIAAVADARRTGHDPELLDGLARHDVGVLEGWAASTALGSGRVRGVVLGSRAGDETRRFACDTLVVSAGRQTDIGVLSTSRARFAYDTHVHAFLPAEMPPGVFAAGGLLGLADPESLEASGRVAALEAAAACGAGDETLLREARERLADAPPAVAGCSILRGPDPGSGRKAFIDFDEDGTWKNVRECMKGGFATPELAKRFGNFGLGPGQYRVPGQNLAMAMATLAGQPLDGIMCTTVRPPVVPPALATLAGPAHDIPKRTPLHDVQAALGGIFRRAGPWLRARYFSDDLACREEIRAVRCKVGMLDSSPLGKFRLFGPDASRALQRIYISDMTKVRPGRCRYSAMCNDTGNIVDDGVVVRVGADDYYLTTSSNRAGATVEWFRYHTRHDAWDYHLVNLTDALASINLAGPNAREVLRRVTTADLSNEAFPYLGYREIELAGGVTARCLRLGFVGELSYELHVPASRARHVWDLLWQAGEGRGIRPFGLEAQYCLRAEKGHVIIGAESEQRVTLLDIGMGWLWDRADTASRKVGAPALRACEGQRGRLKLVGLRIAETDEPPRDGAIVVDGGDVAGHVCTTRDSEALGWRFGLALVRDDLAATGRRLELFEDPGSGARRTAATVTAPHFYDPDGERLRG